MLAQRTTEVDEEIQAAEGAIEKLVDYLVVNASDAVTRRLQSEEAKLAELKSERVILEQHLSEQAKGLTDYHSEAVSLLDQFNNVDDGDKAELRERMAVKFQTFIKSAQRDTFDGRFYFVTKDLTQYVFVYEKRPDAAPKNGKGRRPRTDFHWAAYRGTVEDAALYQARQLVAEGARQKFFMLTDEQFEKARGEAERLLERGAT